jgi:AmiR/NasT family two-component response regulator
VGSVTTTEPVDAAPTGMAEDFAAIEQGDADSSLVLLREIEGLRRALETRSVIGQAIGIVMTRETLTAEAAFGRLVERSSHTNVKVREVAAAIVVEAELRAITG